MPGAQGPEGKSPAVTANRHSIAFQYWHMCPRGSGEIRVANRVVGFNRKVLQLPTRGSLDLTRDRGYSSDSLHLMPFSRYSITLESGVV